MQGKWIQKPQDGTAIIFIHGLLSNSDKCWTNENGTYWPNLLTKEEATKHSGIYVVNYKTGFNSGTYRIGDAVDSIKEYMRLDGVMNCTKIIFVAHSMGGIIARKLIVERAQDFREKDISTGLFLIASPSLGSEYANFIKPLAKFLQHSQLDALRFSQDNSWLNDLDKEFMNLKDAGSLRLQGKELVEDVFFQVKKKWVPWKKQIVEPFSGARYFGEAVKIPNSDHSSISKPSSSDALQHRLLLQFTKDFVAQNSNILQVHQPVTSTESVDVLTTALTGNARSFIPKAIANMHSATKAVLESLDERLVVKTRYEEPTTTFEISAKDEPVPLRMTIEDRASQGLYEKYRNLMAHGEDLIITNVRLSFPDSPLMAELFKSTGNGQGKLHIAPHSVKAVIHLERLDSNGCPSDLCMVNGRVKCGSESAQLEGKALGGLLSFNFNFSKENKLLVTYTMNFTKWEGEDIRALPYFDQFVTIVEALASGEDLLISLEIDGKNRASRGKVTFGEKIDTSGILAHLHYLKCGAKIANHLGAAIRFIFEKWECSKEEYADMLSAASMVGEGRKFTLENLSANPRFTLIAQDEGQNISTVENLATTGLGAIQFILDTPEHVVLFGGKINLPNRVVYISGISMRILNPQENYKNGDGVRFELLPEPNFFGIAKFQA